MKKINIKIIQFILKTNFVELIVKIKQNPIENDEKNAYYFIQFQHNSYYLTQIRSFIANSYF